MTSLIGCYNNLFGDFLSDWGDAVNRSKPFSAPAEVRCEDDACYAEIDLPGVKREDIDITCENGRMVIISRRKRGEEMTEKYRNEFSVSDTLDVSKVDAKLENGVLYITVPKKKRKENKIQIKIS